MIDICGFKQVIKIASTPIVGWPTDNKVAVDLSGCDHASNQSTESIAKSAIAQYVYCTAHYNR
jgi:hypothetical protein